MRTKKIGEGRRDATTNERTAGLGWVVEEGVARPLLSLGIQHVVLCDHTHEHACYDCTAKSGSKVHSARSGLFVKQSVRLRGLTYLRLR